MSIEALIIVTQLTACKHSIIVEFPDPKQEYYAEANLINCSDNYPYSNATYTIEMDNANHILEPFGYPAFEQINTKQN